MKKILFIIGTRPEFIKMAPVYKLFKADAHWEARLISTGQHAGMLNQLFNFFEVKPDTSLNLMEPNQRLASLTARLFERLDLELNRMSPDVVIVQGDTATTLVGAMVSFYLRIPLAHIEAGLRTGNIRYPFPEEANRMMTSIVADYNFCPTENARQNLQKEGRQNVYMVGNSVVDALLWSVKKIRQHPEGYRQKFDKIWQKKQKMVLVTAHRRESFGQGLRNIFRAIKRLAGQHAGVQFVFPVHLNPNVQHLARALLGQNNNITLLEPLPYDELLYIMDHCHLIMTDSGGIQEEAPSLQKPVLVLRNETERTESLDAGLSLLAGTAEDTIVQAFNNLIADNEGFSHMVAADNPYGDGQASEKIKAILDKALL